MIKNKNLPGFTILEVLVTLIILGIIINLTYAIYTLVSQQMLRFEVQNTEMLHYNVFNTALRRELADASYVELNSNNLMLKFYNGQTTTYVLEEEQIFIEKEAKRIPVDVRLINHFLEKDTLKNIHVQLELQVLKDTIMTHYYKKVSAADIINPIFLNETRN
jgi:prepilin-type N-terminal cleavage/methylation domain-containing protein